MMQLVTEKVDLRIVPVDGLLPSLQALSDGSYPFPLRVCLVARDQSSSGVTRFIEFTNSIGGQQILRDFDILLLGKP